MLMKRSLVAFSIIAVFCLSNIYARGSKDVSFNYPYQGIGGGVHQFTIDFSPDTDPNDAEYVIFGFPSNIAENTEITYDNMPGNSLGHFDRYNGGGAVGGSFSYTQQSAIKNIGVPYHIIWKVEKSASSLPDLVGYMGELAYFPTEKEFYYRKETSTYSNDYSIPIYFENYSFKENLNNSKLILPNTLHAIYPDANGNSGAVILYLFGNNRVTGGSYGEFYWGTGFKGKIKIAIIIDKTPPNLPSRPNFHALTRIPDFDGQSKYYTAETSFGIDNFSKLGGSSAFTDTAASITAVVLGETRTVTPLASGLMQTYKIIDESKKTLGTRNCTGDAKNPSDQSALSPYSEGIHSFNIQLTDRADNFVDGPQVTIVVDTSGPMTPPGTVTLQFDDDNEIEVSYSGNLPSDLPHASSASDQTAYHVGLGDNPKYKTYIYKNGSANALLTFDSNEILNQAQKDLLTEGKYTAKIAYYDLLNKLGNPSSESEVAYIDNTDPDAPENLFLESGDAIQNDGVWYALTNYPTLKWVCSEYDAISGFHNYIVEHKIGSNAWGSYGGADQTYDAGQDSLVLDLTKITKVDGKYQLRVVAVDGVGNRGESTAIVIDDMQPMGQPTYDPDYGVYKANTDPSSSVPYELTWLWDEESNWQNSFPNAVITYKAFVVDKATYSLASGSPETSQTFYEDYFALVTTPYAEKRMDAEYFSDSLGTEEDIVPSFTDEYVLCVKAYATFDSGLILTSDVFTHTFHITPTVWIADDVNGDYIDIYHDEYLVEWVDGYNVEADVWIGEGGAIHVLPGANVNLYQYVKVVIEDGGSLLTTGINSDPPALLRYNALGMDDDKTWTGIIANDGCELDISNLIITGAVRGLTLNTTSDISIKNTTFVDNRWAGIQILNVGKGSTISDCTFMHNGVYGIKEDVDLITDDYSFSNLYLGNIFLHKANEQLSDRGYDYYNFSLGVTSLESMNDNFGSNNITITE